MLKQAINMIKKLFLWVSLNLNKDLHRAGRYNNIMIQYLRGCLAGRCL